MFHRVSLLFCRAVSRFKSASRNLDRRRWVDLLLLLLKHMDFVFIYVFLLVSFDKAAIAAGLQVTCSLLICGRAPFPLLVLRASAWLNTGALLGGVRKHTWNTF